MKFAVASEHREFFEKNGYIEFAELLSADQLDRLNSDIRQVLVNRLKLISHSSLDKLKAVDFFRHGRDLWRELPAIKKIAANPLLAEIAWEFCQQKPLRLAYDQYFPAPGESSSFLQKQDLYQAFCSSTASLSELSSVQGVVAGLLLCVSGTSEETTGVFPTVSGHGVFLSPALPVDFSQLPHSCSYYLIVYAIQKSVYISNDKDPLSQMFRQSGYSINDALNDKLNPIILR